MPRTDTESSRLGWAGPIREVRAPGEVTLKKGLKGGVMLRVALRDRFKWV